VLLLAALPSFPTGTDQPLVSHPRPRKVRAGPPGNDSYCGIDAEMTNFELLFVSDICAISFQRACERDLQ